MLPLQWVVPLPIGDQTQTRQLASRHWLFFAISRPVDPSSPPKTLVRRAALNLGHSGANGAVL